MCALHIMPGDLNLTGSRWGLNAAETISKLRALRALRANGDWESYWSYHLSEKRQRVHSSRYLDNVISTAA